MSGEPTGTTSSWEVRAELESLLERDLLGSWDSPEEELPPGTLPAGAARSGSMAAAALGLSGGPWKQGIRRSTVVDAAGIPLGVHVGAANAQDSPLLAPTLDLLPDVGPCPSR